MHSRQPSISHLLRSIPSPRPSLHHLSQAHGPYLFRMRMRPDQALHTTRPVHKSSGPEPPRPPTNLSSLDMLRNSYVPATATISTCLPDGFVLESGSAVHDAGVLLVGGRAYEWRPWLVRASKAVQKGGSWGGWAASAQRDLVDGNGTWDAGGEEEAWGVLELVWPKPDLLIVGTGKEILSLSPRSRDVLSAMGIRVDTLDTRNAAAQYNLLVAERGIEEVAAALVPVGR